MPTLKKILKILSLLILLLVIIFLVIFVSNRLKKPTHDRSWAQDSKILPSVQINDSIISISNIRDWKYAKDEVLDDSYYSDTFDLGKIKNTYLLFNPFGKWEGIGHFWFIFEFENNQSVSISIEARREEGDKYTFVKGMLNNYELWYSIASAQDHITRRIIYNSEDVYMYKILIPSDYSKLLFSEIIENVRDLENNPKFYNTVSSNCTNILIDAANKIKKGSVPFHYSRLFTGFADNHLYRLGFIRNDDSFEKVYKDAYINDNTNLDTSVSNEVFFTEILKKLPENKSAEKITGNSKINSLHNSPLEIISNSSKNSAIVTFVGDIMVDRYIRKIAERNSYDFLFQNVREEFHKSDVVVANLEGPVTDFDSISNSDIPEKRFYFTFSEQVLPSMFDANIKIVSIDNNHITNFGREGLLQTINKLKNNQINYFGNPHDRGILFQNINGVDLAFIAYNQFINPDTDEILKLIQEVEMSANHTIIFAHWGDEYEKIANNNQSELAKNFIDAGADLIIGAHPHVIQNTEIYKNRHIYYSLGNFIFDQYFSKEVSCGLAVTFNFTENTIEILEEKTVKNDPSYVVKFEECRFSN